MLLSNRRRAEGKRRHEASAMKQALRPQMGQTVHLTPQLLQTIRLLQLTAPQLEQELRQALERNPLLEQELPELEADDGIPDALE